MKKREGVKHGVLSLVIIGLMVLSVSAVAANKNQDAHPELTEQEMLMACSDCHRETTPEVEKEWYDSAHGIAMVKCYQCHGTFETFMVTPTVDNCNTCHVKMADEKHTEGKICWECHAPHTFKEKK